MLKQAGKQLLLLSIVVCLLVFCLPAVAQVMTSSHYRIQFDSLNVGGGLSSSTNYKLEGTTGEAATGNSTSTSFRLKAGYQQMNEVYISISQPGTVTSSPSIPGVTGGQSATSVAWIVTTDNPGGYSLFVKSNTSPAMKCVSGGCDTENDYFADYTPLVPSTPDYDWAIDSADSEFGYSPEGAHIMPKFQDDSGACNTGNSDTPDQCWYGFALANEQVAGSYAANHPGGTTTTFKLKAESGNAHIQPEGNYAASITVTAVAN